MDKSISEEILGFIQGYIMAAGNPDDVRDLFPDLDDDAVFAKALEEVSNRMRARAAQHSVAADRLNREAAALEFENAAKTIDELLN